MGDKIRCFVALELGKEAKDKVERIQNLIKKSGLLEAKFTKRDLIHLTLKFLGEINETAIEEIKKRLREVKFDTLDTEISEIGVFSENYIRIVWLHLANCEKLQGEIDKVLKDLFKPENRFMSHITIARVKSTKDKKKLLDFIKSFKIEKKKFVVDKFCLKSSKLFPEGPKYKVIEEFDLT